VGVDRYPNLVPKPPASNIPISPYPPSGTQTEEIALNTRPGRALILPPAPSFKGGGGNFNKILIPLPLEGEGRVGVDRYPYTASPIQSAFTRSGNLVNVPDARSCRPLIPDPEHRSSSPYPLLQRRGSLERNRVPLPLEGEGRVAVLKVRNSLHGPPFPLRGRAGWRC
jgi:hypothetical protein